MDVNINQLNQFIERYACRVPNFYRQLLEEGRKSASITTSKLGEPVQMALLKLSDLQWMTRMCRSIAKL